MGAGPSRHVLRAARSVWMAANQAAGAYAMSGVGDAVTQATLRRRANLWLTVWQLLVVECRGCA